MKKWVIVLFLLLAGVAAILCVPDFVDAYRLQKYITDSAEAYQANGGPWPQVADSCNTCHGPNGNSVNQQSPSLASQRPEYLAEQLQNFSSGQRVFPMMNAMSRSMKDGDIAKLATFFARQPAENNHYFNADESLRQKGQQLVQAGGCAGCHGNELMGRDRFPRLAGQGYDYLLRQLDAFSAGKRQDPTHVMNQFASAWSVENRKAIATFLASHPIAGAQASSATPPSSKSP